jgi:hypothetical protein
VSISRACQKLPGRSSDADERRQAVSALARSCLLFLCLSSSCGYAAAPDPSLIGCWRATRIVVYSPDGSRIEDTSGRCTLHFSDDRFESTCGTSTGLATTTYQYRVERPDFYLATMTGSTFRTSLVGSTREYEYHIDGDRLVTATISQSTSPAAPTGAPRVESEAARTPCP